jgi:predicted DsbA family dithiol-disulfide isomerase
VGFTFGERSRVWNTFDAHRLLCWAGDEGPPGSQRQLKHALLTVYHGEGRNPGDPALLLASAAAAGLDGERARQILSSDDYAATVREREAFWQEAGIHSVPAVVIDRRHLISGGQPPEVFEQALRQIAAGG